MYIIYMILWVGYMVTWAGHIVTWTWLHDSIHPPPALPDAQQHHGGWMKLVLLVLRRMHQRPHSAMPIHLTNGTAVNRRSYEHLSLSLDLKNLRQTKRLAPFGPLRPALFWFFPSLLTPAAAPARTRFDFCAMAKSRAHGKRKAKITSQNAVAQLHRSWPWRQRQCRRQRWRQPRQLWQPRLYDMTTTA